MTASPTTTPSSRKKPAGKSPTSGTSKANHEHPGPTPTGEAGAEPGFTHCRGQLLRADDDQVEVGVLVGAGFVASVDFDRVGVRRRRIGLGVAGVRHRRAGVVAPGDLGAATDVLREGD